MVTEFQYPSGDEGKPFVRQPGAKTFWFSLGLAAICAASSLLVPLIEPDAAQTEVRSVLVAMLICCAIIASLPITLNRGSWFGEVWIVFVQNKDFHVYRTATTHMPGAYFRYLNGGNLTRLLCPGRRTGLGNVGGHWTITGIKGPAIKTRFWRWPNGFFQSLRFRIRDYHGGEIGWLTMQEVLEIVGRFQTVTDYRTNTRLLAMAHDFLGTSLCAIQLSRSSGLARKLADAALTEWQRRFSGIEARPGWTDQAAEVLADLQRLVDKDKDPDSAPSSPGTIACGTTVV